MTLLIYNEGYMKTQSIFYRLFDDSFIVANSYLGSYQSNGEEIAKCNTIIGISAFAISNSNTTNIFSDVSEFNQINIWSSYLLEEVKISFLSIYSEYCDYKSPYFESMYDVCYITCPQKSQNSNMFLTCICYDKEGYTIITNDNCIQIASNQS